jgi:hypothetical protein
MAQDRVQVSASDLRTNARRSATVSPKRSYRFVRTSIIAQLGRAGGRCCDYVSRSRTRRSVSDDNRRRSGVQILLVELSPGRGWRPHDHAPRRAWVRQVGTERRCGNEQPTPLPRAGCACKSHTAHLVREWCNRQHARLPISQWEFNPPLSHYSYQYHTCNNAPIAEIST